MPYRASVPLIARGLRTRGKDRVAEACRFVHEHLSALKRRSGESYAAHGCEVAQVLRDVASDPSLLSVAILHDILLHPEGEALLSAAPLTDNERRLVVEMHPLRRLHIDENTDDLDKVIDAFTSNERLLPLRMAHRLNDIRHLERFTDAQKRSIARETLHMYAAIAGRLGMQAWKGEMEDICFRLLQPKIAAGLATEFQSSAPLDDACLEHAQRFLEDRLRSEGISCTISARKKNLYSTYRKMVIKRRSFGELTDRLALRIIVPETNDCYRALGVVHAAFHPMPGKLKDYIGAPKENGYRSIHTVVYPLSGVTEQPIEIQVRTPTMHGECEFGVARHGEYKTRMYALHSGPARVDLLRNLQILRGEARTPAQFEKVLRTYFRDDHIALFDADNTLYHMSKKVTALDFACEVHGKRVKYLKAIKINGRLRPLPTPLSDGDTVEALFGREIRLRREWKSVCHLRAARLLLQSLISSSTPAREQR